jgi:hypothetical protein
MYNNSLNIGKSYQEMYCSILRLRNGGENTWDVGATHPGSHLGAAPDIKQ